MSKKFFYCNRKIRSGLLVQAKPHDLDGIVCDAYAGINRMGLGADKLQNAVRTEADRAASQSTKKPAQTRGPPERYAIIGDGKMGSSYTRST